jgi:hypothetical protein
MVPPPKKIQTHQNLRVWPYLEIVSLLLYLVKITLDSGWTLNPLTGIHKTPEDTQKHSKEFCRKTEADRTNAYINQEMSEIVGKLQQLGERQEGSLPLSLWRSTAPPIPDFRFPVLQNHEKINSVV